MKNINTDKLTSKRNKVAKNLDMATEHAAYINETGDLTYIEFITELLDDAESLIAEMRREIAKKTAN